MDILPNELVLIIFDNILKTTDKRIFLKTCMKYNILTKNNFSQYEKNYKIKHFEKITKYCIEKFTLELCHDSYFDMIPELYIINKNNILIRSLVAFGCISLLKEMVNNGYDLDSICFYASYYSNLEILKWSRENNYKWDYTICANASHNGNIECLKWAMANGCGLNTDICSVAAENGHLEILKWARENGCDWNSFTYQIAKKCNQIEILKWLDENGCPKY